MTRNAAGMPVSPVVAIRGGDDPGGDGQRGDAGQDEEQHGGHAEPVAGQRPGHGAGLGVGRLPGSWDIAGAPV